MNVYIGLDVSLASTAVCVLHEKGKIVTETEVASTPEALVSFMDKLEHEIAAIGLEAGPLSHWLHKGMTDAGFEAVLMETRQVKAALKAMPIKTDRRDAEGIRTGSGRQAARMAPFKWVNTTLGNIKCCVSGTQTPSRNLG